MTTTATHHAILFDGQCALCDSFVRFVIARDAQARFRFASLQGAYAKAHLREHAKIPEKLDTIYVHTTDGKLLQKTRAALFMLTSLKGSWRAVRIFSIVPDPISDLAYDALTASRYRIFGYASCRVPSAEEKRRFLE